MIQSLPSLFGKPFEFVATSIWKNGIWSPIVTSDVPNSLSFDTNGAHYGAMVIEGMKGVNPENTTYVFRPIKHYERMVKGCERMALPEPPQEMFLDGICGVMKAIKKSGDSSTDYYIRPFIFASSQTIGAYSADEYTFAVLAMPHTTVPGKTSRIVLEFKDKRTWPGGTGAVKAGGNYGAGKRADMIALQSGKTVLWIDSTNTYLQETTTSSVMFVLKDNTLVSPRPDGCILDSVTRSTILDNCHKINLRPDSRLISVEQLNHWLATNFVLEAFLVGTAITATPITDIQIWTRNYRLPFSYAGSYTESIFTMMKEFYRTKNDYTMIVA